MFFFPKGNGTKCSFILNCPGAGVDCGSCWVFSLSLSLNSQFVFPFLPSTVWVLKEKEERIYATK